jgi:hypothetical protein
LALNDHNSYDTTNFFQVYSSGEYMPEKRLLVAVIQRALADFTVPDGTHPLLKWEAGKWLFSDSHEIMSLWWICSALSDDPKRLRDKILAAAKQKSWRQKAVIFRVDRR